MRRSVILVLLLSVVASGGSITTIGSVVDGGALGSLRVVERIGKGRNSIVLRAQLADAGGDGGESYVIKAREDMSDPDGQLAREAEVLTALNSIDGFPRMYASFPERGYIVMEMLIRFRSLDRFNQTKDPVPVPVEAIAISLLDRLEAVHSAGFVHVDVHPRNIMVDPMSGEVALLDFGLAVKRDEPKNPEWVHMHLSSVREQARQLLYPLDDIERLVYVLVDYFYGSLPWSMLTRMREAMEAELVRDVAFTRVVAALEQRMLGMKQAFSTYDEFFASHRIPRGFQDTLRYIAYATSMRDKESFVVQYDLLRSFFRSADSTGLPVEGAAGLSRWRGFLPSLLPIAEDDGES